VGQVGSERSAPSRERVGDGEKEKEEREVEDEGEEEEGQEGKKKERLKFMTEGRSSSK
jgi:hypothetical protein